jgi:chromosome segregation ATPase
MDEVEPALDDLNLQRFLRLVAGFARDAQVMIVTHQKRTMEIASMMYGVSLNKDGTTKVLCQRLEPVEPPAAEAPDRPDDGDAEEVVEVPETEPVG